MSDRVSTVIKCSDCGKTTTVSFKPKTDRPVYCRDCLAKHRASSANSGKRTETAHSSPDSEKQAWSRRRESWK
jgi:CxxC-x17-CxxC domain-containing protein